MKNHKIILAIICSAFMLHGCGTRQSKKVVSSQTFETAEETNLSRLTEELSVKETDEDIQVFTMKIGNDPQKSHLTASFPVTKYSFVNEEESRYTQLFIDEFKNEAEKSEEEGVSALDFNQHFEVKHHSDALLAFLYSRSVSFGNNYDDTFHASILDLKNKKKLTVAELFKNVSAFENFASEIRVLAQKAVREKLNQSDDFANPEEKETVWENMLSNIEEGTMPEEKNYDALFFDENKEWFVIFDKYQIASGSMGSFTISVPQTLINKYLSKKVSDLLYQSKKMAEASPEPLKQEKEVAFVQDSKTPCVALTFDDGPSVYTSKLLDILKEEDVKATFFILGKSAAVQKQTLRRMAQEGHNIGNHSYDHKDFSKISTEEATKQISLTDDIAEEITGSKPYYFRFPYGAYTKDKLLLVNRPVISWNVDPLDWKYRDAERIATEMSKASANAIILGHDIHKTTVEAIPQVIRALKAKGFRIVSLDEMFATKQIQNNSVYSSGK